MASRKVFISSRIKEMENERDAVESVFVNLREKENINFISWRLEKESKTIPSAKSPDVVQSENLKESDIYLLILGSEYGRKKGMSPTHKEYNEALFEIDKDCILIYAKNDEDTVQKRDERLKKWIEEMRETRTCKPFKNVEELKIFVKNRLRHLWYEKFEKGVSKRGSGLDKSDMTSDDSHTHLVEALHKLRR